MGKEVVRYYLLDKYWNNTPLFLLSFFRKLVHENEIYLSFCEFPFFTLRTSLIKHRNFATILYFILNKYLSVKFTKLNLRELKYTSALIFMVCFNVHGQIQDSLSKKSTVELFELYRETAKKETRILIVKTFLKKAKEKKSMGELISGYYMLEDLYDDTNSIAFLDSVMDVKIINEEEERPMLDHLNKGYLYEKKHDYINAMVAYLFFNTCSIKSNNCNLIALSSYNISVLKRKMKEGKVAALKFLKESLNFNNNRGKYHLSLASILEIANVYTLFKNTDSLMVFTSLGKELALKLKDTMSYHQLSVNEAIIDYETGDISNAISKFEKEKLFYEKRKKRKCLIYPYFYLAKAYYSKEDKKNSISYLKKVDSIFQLEKCLFPAVREAYTLLIEYSKELGNLNDQELYVHRLVHFDSILYQDKFYLSKQIFKEYTRAKLKSEKKVITGFIRENEKSSIINVLILFVLFICIFIIGFFQYKKRKFYQNRSRSIEISSNTTVTNSATIPEEIVEDILFKLEEFEQDKKYLLKSITLISLAKEIHTNTNYLSKVINNSKGSSFSNYLNTLRITYIVTELNLNNQLRKFTIQALSEEAGFNTSESFAKAFYKMTNANPSDYIKEMENNY